MIKVGLTGGIGSGKTTVANFFRELGVPVYVADLEAKKIMNSSKKIKKKLIEEFGELTYKEGKLNRAYLASVVFNNKDKLNAINSIVHPEVAKHFSKWVGKQEVVYVIQENAILYENNAASNFDFIITVTAPFEVKIDRVIERDSVAKIDVLSRVRNQLDDSKKIELSDFVINNIDLTDTKKQVEKLHEKLLKIKTKKDNS